MARSQQILGTVGVAGCFRPMGRAASVAASVPVAGQATAIAAAGYYLTISLSMRKYGGVTNAFLLLFWMALCLNSF